MFKNKQPHSVRLSNPLVAPHDAHLKNMGGSPQTSFLKAKPILCFKRFVMSP